MTDFQLYVFDLDGVLFRGNQPMPHAVQAVSSLREMGKAVRFMTNNSTMTRRDYADKLGRLCCTCSVGEIQSSASAAARIIGRSSCYVIGEDGLRAELLDGGASIVDDSSPADWVVVGACWTFTYSQMDEGQWRIRNGAKYMATNLDRNYPVEDGRLRPGAGAINASIAVAAGKEPDCVAGKPDPAMVDIFLNDLGCSPENALVIGDQIETDIECGKRAGCKTALVLTGVTSAYSEADGKPKPDYVLQSLGELCIVP